MLPHRTAFPPPQDPGSSILTILRALELALSDPDFRDDMESGAASVTPAQGEALLHDTKLLITDIVNGRLGILLSAAQANEPELQVASKKMDKALKNIANTKTFLDKATRFLEILKKLAGWI